MEDFQFGDALAAEVGLETRFLRGHSDPVVGRHPAVAIAVQAREERTAGADFVEAELEDLPALFLGDAPFILYSSSLPSPHSRIMSWKVEVLNTWTPRFWVKAG